MDEWVGWGGRLKAREWVGRRVGGLGGANAAAAPSPARPLPTHPSHPSPHTPLTPPHTPLSPPSHHPLTNPPRKPPSQPPPQRGRRRGAAPGVVSAAPARAGSCLWLHARPQPPVGGRGAVGGRRLRATGGGAAVPGGWGGGCWVGDGWVGWWVGGRLAGWRRGLASFVHTIEQPASALLDLPCVHPAPLNPHPRSRVRRRRGDWTPGSGWPSGWWGGGTMPRRRWWRALLMRSARTWPWVSSAAPSGMNDPALRHLPSPGHSATPSTQTLPTPFCPCRHGVVLRHLPRARRRPRAGIPGDAAAPVP